jgi:hypothetical protein
MSYNAAYNRALLKFAQAPGIGSFIRAADGQPVHHHNPHDLALADFLQDHDDPRHLIVQRHLEGTKQPGDHVSAELERRLGPEFEGEWHQPADLPLSDGNVSGFAFKSPESGQRAISTTWMATAPNGPRRLYRAVLTPAEHAHLVNSLAPNHTLPVNHDQIPVDLT